MLPDRLTALEVEVRDMKKVLFDNGQPGFISKTEARLGKLDKIVWLGMGALGVLQILSANGLLSVHKLLGG